MASLFDGDDLAQFASSLLGPRAEPPPSPPPETPTPPDTSAPVEPSNVIPLPIAQATEVALRPRRSTPPPPPNPEWKKLLNMRGSQEEGNLRMEPTANNVALLLENHEDFRGFIRWNEYSKRIDITGGVLGAYRNMEIEHVITFAVDHLTRAHRISVDYSNVQKRLFFVAKRNPYDPLIDHLMDLATLWDGGQRIDELFTRYFGAGKPEEDEDPAALARRLGHLRRISRRWMLGSVERAFRPGCKFDNVLVLEGLQGARKTSAIEALGGDFYSSTQIVLGDKDSKMIAAANWFVDLPDTNFMKKTNRGFITQREDTYRPPFGAAVQKTPRRCVFIASSMNDLQYTEEEERRYWSVLCTSVDLVALMRDRDQLWAEAAAISLAAADCPDCRRSTDTVARQAPRCVVHRWWLDAEEEKIAMEEASKRVQDVPWKTRILQWWLSKEPAKRPLYFSIEDVASDALSISIDKLLPHLYTAIGTAVKSAGFTRKRLTVEGGSRDWRYVPNQLLARAPKSGSLPSLPPPGGGVVLTLPKPVK